ncbi:Glycoside hydrolase [Trema orientale]|uniref:Glycoside hydrolase n=1 Tax=Trema orientale TaxID=63057 RepID=A0A2P5FQM3_TREOI|nr:Glycoside hydrolase [Trema orientale]
MAASRALDFMFGWIVDPIMLGDYPETMKSLVASRLPKFTKEQSKLIKGSIDFLGANYYTAMYAEDDSDSYNVDQTYSTDSKVKLTSEKDGIPIGEPTSSSWLYAYPKGIEDFTMYIKTKYNNPATYITENGVADQNLDLTLINSLNDTLRIKYHQQHLSHLLVAINAGADVRGYYAWSFLDDFEWDAGYTIRFGLVYIDYKNVLRRYKKESAKWFQKFLQKKNIIGNNSSSFIL